VWTAILLSVNLDQTLINCRSLPLFSRSDVAAYVIGRMCQTGDPRAGSALKGLVSPPGTGVGLPACLISISIYGIVLARGPENDGIRCLNWQRGERLIPRWYALDARMYQSSSEALRFGYLSFPTTPKPWQHHTHAHCDSFHVRLIFRLPNLRYRRSRN